MKISVLFPALLFFILTGCEKVEKYPVEPVITYKKHSLYIRTDTALGNRVAVVQLEIEFTDGDGDIGMKQPDYEEENDSLVHNLFMSLYDVRGGLPNLVEEINNNYRIPYITREGPNKTLKGTIIIDLEYPIINYDTIFYSFYLFDRKFHKSNVDSSDVIVLSGILD